MSVIRSQFKVEKNVPLPGNAGKGGAYARYPWKQMQIGDSLFVEGFTAAQFSGRVSYARKSLGLQFISRTVDGGCRVWRVA